jgi:hypothetical protein
MEKRCTWVSKYQKIESLWMDGKKKLQDEHVFGKKGKSKVASFLYNPKEKNTSIQQMETSWLCKA